MHIKGIHYYNLGTVGETVLQLFMPFFATNIKDVVSGIIRCVVT